MDLFVRFQLIDLIHRDALRDVKISLLQLQALCGRILDDMEDHMRDGRGFPGVILLCIDLDRLTRGIGRDLIRTGAHRMGRKVRSPHIVVLRLIHDLRIHDARCIDGKGVEEGGEWFLQMENHRRCIGRLDGFHHFEIVGRPFLHLLDTFDGEFHRLRIDRRTICKFMPVRQMEGPCEPIAGDIPRLCEPRLDLRRCLAVHGLIADETLICRISDGPARIIHRDRRIERFRILRQPHDQRILRHAARLRCAAAAAACQRNQSRSHQGTQYDLLHSLSHMTHTPFHAALPLSLPSQKAAMKKSQRLL